MTCRKCKREIPPDSVYCKWCGIKQSIDRHARTRPNGAGYAFKRGRTWTACVVAGWKPDGKRINKTKGGFPTKRDALEYCQALKSKPSKEKHAGITFAVLYGLFLDRHVGRVGKSTMNCYKAAYQYYSSLFDMRFADITTPDMQACVDSCPHGKRTKENMKALGTLLYKLALEMNIVSKNYAQFIWIPPAEKASYHPFSHEHESVLLRAALSGDFGASLIACDCYLGFRPAELLSIKKREFDPLERVLRGGMKTEAGRNRAVPISQKIQPIIDRLMQSDSEYLFSDRKEPLKINYYRDYIFYPTLERLAIQAPGERYYMPYSCRHTFATKLKNVTGSQKDKAALMGHTSYEMTYSYQHEDLQSKRAITDAL